MGVWDRLRKKLSRAGAAARLPADDGVPEEIRFRYMGKSEQIVGRFGDAPIHDHIVVHVLCRDGVERPVSMRHDGAHCAHVSERVLNSNLRPDAATACLGFVLDGVRYVGRVPNWWIAGGHSQEVGSRN